MSKMMMSSKLLARARLFSMMLFCFYSGLGSDQENITGGGPAGVLALVPAGSPAGVVGSEDARHEKMISRPKKFLGHNQHQNIFKQHLGTSTTPSSPNVNITEAICDQILPPIIGLFSSPCYLVGLDSGPICTARMAPLIAAVPELAAVAVPACVTLCTIGCSEISSLMNKGQHDATDICHIMYGGGDPGHYNPPTPSKDTCPQMGCVYSQKLGFCVPKGHENDPDAFPCEA
ncbi:unnamed protein product [Amoebophrya sp. A120]|nr:unnamed protein product [Amoebophrya sp. A120]|eukprot:GSA120T00013292001.1